MCLTVNMGSAVLVLYNMHYMILSSCYITLIYNNALYSSKKHENLLCMIDSFMLCDRFCYI